MFVVLTRAATGEPILINLATVTHIREVAASHGEGVFTQVTFIGDSFAHVRELLPDIQARIVEREMAK